VEEHCDGELHIMRDAVELNAFQKVQLRAHACVRAVPKPLTMGQQMTSFSMNTTRNFTEGGFVTRARLRRMCVAHQMHFNITDFDTLWKFLNPRLKSGCTVKELQARVQREFRSKNATALVDAIMGIARSRLGKRNIAGAGFKRLARGVHTAIRKGKMAGDARLQAEAALQQMKHRYEHSLYERPWMRNTFGCAPQAAPLGAHAYHFGLLGQRSCKGSTSTATANADALIASIAGSA
jgi:hypothetical protein